METIPPVAVGAPSGPHGIPGVVGSPGGALFFGHGPCSSSIRDWGRRFWCILEKREHLGKSNESPVTGQGRKGNVRGNFRKFPVKTKGSL